MKKVLIVTYDLSNPGRNYEGLLQRIKSYDGWARLGGSSYLIHTDQTPVQIRDNLLGILDANDTMYISSLGDTAAWYGLGDEVSKWIRNNQK